MVPVLGSHASAALDVTVNPRIRSNLTCTQTNTQSAAVKRKQTKIRSADNTVADPDGPETCMDM